MAAFDAALKVILRHEGGYVNHPKDPGGETNFGVTKRVWLEWIGKREANMKALTPAKVAPLYRAMYWDKLKCDQLPPALALCVFDMGVNAGVNRAAKMLQGMVGAVRDGAIGPGTMNALTGFLKAHGLAYAVRSYQRSRRDYYRALDTFDTFGRGWLRRVDETETEALRLIP